ncbi:hypothetical protein IFR05_009498 [Cadophora sp. M221]|nr:hypothetical protein IFR05_009498 [Cadophora sp. M221]
MASEVPSPQHGTEHKRDLEKQKHIPTVATQDLSGYTPQRHVWAANRRRIEKSKRVGEWRDEVAAVGSNTRPVRDGVKKNEVVDEILTLMVGLPSGAGFVQNEGRESRIDLLVRDAAVVTGITTLARPTARENKPVEEARTPVPRSVSRIEIVRHGESSESRIDLPVRDAAAPETSTNTPSPSAAKHAKGTPRTILLRGYSRDGSTVLRKARTAPRVRDVAASAIRWRETPAQEPLDKEPLAIVPPLPPPIFPTPKNILPVRTYKTQARSMLPELSQRSDTGRQSPEYDTGGDDGEVEEKSAKNGYDLEPSTSSFQYPEDGSPLVVSQESRSLEEYLRRGQRASPVKDEGLNSLPVGVLLSDEEGKVEVYEGQNEKHDLHGEDDEEQAEEKEVEDEQEQNHIVDDESLSEMEIQLLDMAGSYETSPLHSASSSPKRPRTAEDFESGNGEKQNNGGGSPLADAEEQMPAKKRRTERRVPSAETRKAALQRLNGIRAAKATRQTSDIATVVVTKAKRTKKPKKEKLAKQPRRLPVDGELITGPERLDDSDMEPVIAPPLELSEDPISQIYGSEGRENTKRDRSKAMKIKKSKGFGKVDTSLFRMPERPQLQGQDAQNINFSDGFSGKEREAIGRLMPIKQPSRRKQTCQHIPVRYGELSLVSERPAEETPEEPRHRHKKSQKAKKAVSRSVVSQHDDEPMLLDEEEGPQHIDPMFQNLDTTYEAAKPQTPIVTDKSMLSSTPAGNTSPLKNKSQKFRHVSRDFQQVQTKTESQTPAAGNLQEENDSQPPSTIRIPTLIKSDKQLRKDQIASQEISMVVMKRPSHHDHERNQKCESDDQELADDEERERSCEGESEEDEPHLTAFENEDDEDAQEVDVTDELDLEPEAKISFDEDGNTEADDNLNDQVVDLRNMAAGDHDEEHSVQPPSTVQTSRGGVAMSRPHLQEIANLVLEIQHHTAMEKARLKEKSQTPVSSQRARTTYLSKVRSQESRSSQKLAVTNHPSNSVKSEALSTQRSQHNTCELDSSWRPRVPDTRGPLMQVDEEIDDSPTPPRERERVARSRIRSLRRRSSIRSQPLYVVDEIPETASFEGSPDITLDSQAGSIILGNTQNFHRSFPADIPETQVENDEEEARVVMVPSISYFSQASQNLSQPLRASMTNRTLSTPTRARVHFEDGNGLMVGGIKADSEPTANTKSKEEFERDNQIS